MADGTKPLPAAAASTARYGLVLSLILASSCGFHLRGSVLLPDDIDAVHLQVANPALGEEIKLLLEAGDAVIAPTNEGADITLLVTPERLGRRLLAVDPKTGKAREFELTYAISCQVLAKEGQTLMPDQTISLSRDLVFDPEAVIGSAREEEIIYTEMRRDAARQIMARMQSALNP